jgi:hypothetical protein
MAGAGGLKPPHGGIKRNLAVVADSAMRKSLSPWLIGSLTIALCSFLAGLFGPLGGVGGSRYAAILFVVSPALGLVWAAVVLVAMFAIRWRAMWLFLGAPLALFWPAIIELFVRAIARCHLQHPGIIGGCVP